MKQSKLFTKTTKNIPKDEVSLNAKLLIQAGFISKEMAGVYVFLPLGLRTLNKIVQVIREEMNNIGGEEIFMSALQNPASWEKSGRWDDNVLDVWFKTKLQNDSEIGLAATHEEPLTMIMKSFISSYRDLPAYPYQFQTKFRNEVRSKSGIMRGREFLMKDLYSFNTDLEEHEDFYNSCAEAYKKVFKRVGIGDKTFFTFASGGSFSKYSHEFQTISEVGEDTIYVSEEKNIAINEEVFTDEVIKDLGLNKEDLVERKAIEVGNIFNLGTKFSEALDLKFSNKNGDLKPVWMGSYGIGPSRLMGTIVELLSDDKGIMWPEEVAPFKAHLISLKKNEEANKIYEDLTKKGIEVLYDDRGELSPGEKFADSDLIGCPYRIVVSEKTLKEDSVEIKKRDSENVELVKINELGEKLK